MTRRIIENKDITDATCHSVEHMNGTPDKQAESSIQVDSIGLLQPPRSSDCGHI